MTKAITRFFDEYRFLSNFYPAEFMYVGYSFATSENAYQAMKMKTIEDFVLVADAPTPGKAKRLGRKLPTNPDWDDIKVGIMGEILRKKFAIPQLREKLLATGDAHLEEGNKWGDQFWGTVDGVGENNLGKLLMEIREKIRRNK